MLVSVLQPVVLFDTKHNDYQNIQSNYMSEKNAEEKYMCVKKKSNKSNDHDTTVHQIS